MQTKKQASIVRKTFYVMMLLSVFLSTFGTTINLPVASAKDDKSLIDDNYEENDSLGAAYDLSIQKRNWLSTINGYGKQIDEDWYKISVTSNYNRVLIDLRFTHSQGDIDVDLYDSAGGFLATSDGGADNEYIDYTVPASGGTYYIKVYLVNAGNQYDLWWDNIQVVGLNPGTYWTGEFGYAQGWRVDQHPRFLKDVNGDDRPDAVGFANGGVIVGINNGSGFNPGTYWTSEFGYAQGWRVDQHPRFLQDMNKDGRPDVVGFANGGVIVALNNGSGFNPGTYWTGGFGYNQAWRVDQHPRFLQDMNGDNHPDVVGFANMGIVVGINTGSSIVPSTLYYPGTFWTGEFGYDQGWHVDQHPRFLQDMNGDGRPDVVGFANGGIIVGINNGSGINPGTFWTGEFGSAQGWLVDQHPRFLQDMNGDNRPDAVGFANGGVIVGINNGTGGFNPGTYWTGEFGYAQGWRVDQHPRFLQDMNGDNLPDVVGFANGGVIVGINNGSGFNAGTYWTGEFGYAQGWRVDQHPRFLQDMNGDGRPDAVGIGNGGVIVGTSE